MLNVMLVYKVPENCKNIVWEHYSSRFVDCEKDEDAGVLVNIELGIDRCHIPYINFIYGNEEYGYYCEDVIEVRFDLHSQALLDVFKLLMEAKFNIDNTIGYRIELDYTKDDNFYIKVEKLDPLVPDNVKTVASYESFYNHYDRCSEDSVWYYKIQYHDLKGDHIRLFGYPFSVELVEDGKYKLHVRTEELRYLEGEYEPEDYPDGEVKDLILSSVEIKDSNNKVHKCLPLTLQTLRCIYHTFSSYDNNVMDKIITHDTKNENLVDIRY